MSTRVKTAADIAADLTKEVKRLDGEATKKMMRAASYRQRAKRLEDSARKTKMTSNKLKIVARGLRGRNG
jgi:hypothetical protein